MRHTTLPYGPFHVTTYGGGVCVLVERRSDGAEHYVQGESAALLVDELEDLFADHREGVGRAGRLSEYELADEILGGYFDE